MLGVAAIKDVPHNQMRTMRGRHPGRERPRVVSENKWLCGCARLAYPPYRARSALLAKVSNKFDILCIDIKLDVLILISKCIRIATSA